MKSRPKQDSVLELGSMKPLALYQNNQNKIEKSDLPIEEDRKISFSKRLSLPNHYSL